jgi:hypothetical protein
MKRLGENQGTGGNRKSLTGWEYSEKVIGNSM